MRRRFKENSKSSLQKISTKIPANMFGNNKSSKLKTKNKSTPRLTSNSTSSTPISIESETPVTTPNASTTFYSKMKFEDLLEMISIQDNKINKLVTRVTNLEQMLREVQSCNLIVTNAVNR